MLRPLQEPSRAACLPDKFAGCLGQTVDAIAFSAFAVFRTHEQVWCGEVAGFAQQHRTDPLSRLPQHCQERREPDGRTNCTD